MEEATAVDSFECDGYERLHEEEMDRISVSICSDYEETFTRSSNRNVAAAEAVGEEKKMKISLSQEQLKLNSNKNFLTVPTKVKKQRSASFSVVDIGKSVEILEAPVKKCSLNISKDLLDSKQPIHHSDINDVNEIIYAVPQKHFSLNNNTSSPKSNSLERIKPSSASTLTLSHEQTNAEGNFKYPMAFYCKICNKILNDPRTLDCLHSFCCMCLVQLDASNNLQNNQFWRKISDSSSFQDATNVSRSSVDSEITTQKLNTPERRISFLSGSSKSPRKFLMRSISKDKSPTRGVKGRNSSIISFSEKPKSIICPVCGQTTEMTIHGVYRLPQNTLMARKIKETIGSNQDDPNSCQLCSFTSSIATSICLTCSFKLCNSCKDAHKKHTSNHEIKKLQHDKKSSKKSSNDKSSSRDTSIKCLTHQNNDLKLFCTTCCYVICSECTILIHRGHKMTSIPKASKIYIEMLRDAKDNTKPLTTYAIHSISKLNEISKKINQKCDAVEQDVEIFLAEYFEALQVHKRTMLNQIARCRETKMDMIQSRQMDLERRSSEAKAAMAFTEQLLRDGTDVEGLMYVNMLLRRFDKCRGSERLLDIKINDSLQFLPEVRAPTNQEQKNIPLYGIITTQIAVARNCTLEMVNGPMNLRVHKKAEVVLMTRDNEERAMCHGCANVDVSVLYRDVTFKMLPVHVCDKRDGTYIISFIPDTPGLIQITINVNGKPIKNSPFTVRARNLRPHSGIFHCCSFCSSNAKKTCACGGVMKVDGSSREGCGHGHDGWPGRRHWSCCASLLENSECAIANELKMENLEED